MKSFDDLGESAKFALFHLGDASYTAKPEEKSIKSGYPELQKEYFDSDDLRKIAEGLLCVADWLEKRAESAIFENLHEIGGIYQEDDTWAGDDMMGASG